MKLLQFKQEVCGPCKSTDEFIKNVIQKEPDETYMLFAGDKKSNELADKYGIMQTPSFVLTEDSGEKIEIVRGANFAKISEMFETRYSNQD